MKQQAAAKAADNADGSALAQMALDYLSAPGEYDIFYSLLRLTFYFTAASVDPERLFSFSDGTISKIRNQLSDNAARATVLIGQWARNPELVAQEEFEQALADGWTRKKKERPQRLQTAKVR